MIGGKVDDPETVIDRLLTWIDQPTRLITASEDDTSPIVMVWDLRNSLAPEKASSKRDVATPRIGLAC